MKELLSKIRFADMEIKSLVQLRKRMESNAVDLKAIGTEEKVSGSRTIDGSYGIVNKYIDVEKVISDKLKELVEDKKRALAIINTLDNPIHRIVLIERYFNSQSFKSIAITIDRSEKWTRDLHWKALIELSKAGKILV